MARDASPWALHQEQGHGPHSRLVTSQLLLYLHVWALWSWDWGRPLEGDDHSCFNAIGACWENRRGIDWCLRPRCRVNALVFGSPSLSQRLLESSIWTRPRRILEVRCMWSHVRGENWRHAWWGDGLGTWTKHVIRRTPRIRNHYFLVQFSKWSLKRWNTLHRHWKNCISPCVTWRDRNLLDVCWGFSEEIDVYGGHIADYWSKKHCCVGWNPPQDEYVGRLVWISRPNILRQSKGRVQGKRDWSKHNKINEKCKHRKRPDHGKRWINHWI